MNIGSHIKHYAKHRRSKKTACMCVCVCVGVTYQSLVSIRIVEILEKHEGGIEKFKSEVSH